MSFLAALENPDAFPPNPGWPTKSDVFENSPVFLDYISAIEASFPKIQRWADAARDLCEISQGVKVFILIAFLYLSVLSRVHMTELFCLACGTPIAGLSRPPAENAHVKEFLKIIQTISDGLDSSCRNFTVQTRDTVLTPVSKHRGNLDIVLMQARENFRQAQRHHENNLEAYCSYSRRLGAKRNSVHIELATAVYNSQQALCDASLEYAALLTEVDQINRNFVIERAYQFNKIFSDRCDENAHLLHQYRPALEETFTNMDLPRIELSHLRTPYPAFNPFQEDLARFHRSIGLTPKEAKSKDPIMGLDFDEEDQEQTDMLATASEGQMKGHLFRRYVEQSTTVWRRRYFCIHHPEGILMQYRNSKGWDAIADLKICNVNPVKDLYIDRNNVIKISGPSNAYLSTYTHLV
ncbi:uncharacterized protein VTP21DRAFT_1258 [Calcarisporiella thermophila]|uniref:uncharacterized protein n=1 Tax=Calcarisporiella thermophila TaxID=911321 RepID=UPI00374320C4